MIGSFLITGILEHVPAVGMPGGIEASLPDGPPSVAPPEEDPLPAPEELPLPLPPLLPEDELPPLLPEELPPLEEPLLDPELPDAGPAPSEPFGADPSSEVPPVPPGLAGDVLHDALDTNPTNAANPVESTTLVLMISSGLHEPCRRDEDAKGSTERNFLCDRNEARCRWRPIGRWVLPPRIHRSAAKRNAQG
jgi:hypothetical protein